MSKRKAYRPRAVIADPLSLEVWKRIPSEPNYEASSLGGIRRCVPGPNTRVGRRLKGLEARGYLVVCTSHDGLVRRRPVHVLVAEAFHGPRPDGFVVRHKDGDAKNNAEVNIGYATQKENILDKVKHGTMPMGERHHKVRMSDAEMLAALRDAKVIGQKPAGRKHGVSQAVLQRILAGKCRAYLLEQL